MKKNIIIAFFLLIIMSVGFIVYHEWTKGKVDVQSSAAIKISSTDLYNEYIKDTVESKKKYLDKILQVKGIANSISKNQQNQTVIQISTSVDGAFVNGTFDKINDGTEIKAGDTVELKGICNGMGEGDKDLGISGDVYLTRCYIVK